jgi:DNA polymerase I-like protein with 3'-5' exonuclease and polymerase domains
MKEAVDWLGRTDLLATDVETIPHITKAKKPQPFVMTVVSYTGVTDSAMKSYAFQLTTQKSALQPEHPLAEQALLAIQQINANPVRKTLHNGAYDSAWFLRYGVPLANYAYDSMTMFWSRYPDLPKTLAFVASILLDDHKFWKMGRKEEDFTNHTIYAMEDTETTLRCTFRLLEWMSQDPMMVRNFALAHLRCLTALGMGMKGMLVDEDAFESMAAELRKKSEEKLAELRFLIDDEDFNPNSAPAKKNLFYDLLGATPRNAKGRILKRTGGNAKVSVGAVVLRGLKSEHPILRRVVSALQNAQEPAKQVSNVIGIERHSERVHTSYGGVDTTTTRLGSRKDAFGFGANLQNIRKKYRRFLRAEKKNSFIIGIDLSAADDIYMSYESEEAKKIKIIEEGYDTHAYNVAEVFFTNWEYERVVAGKREFLDQAKTIINPDYVLVTHPITGVRQIVKKTTHGCNYLMAGMTLLNSAGREAIVAAAKHLGHVDAGIWSIPQLVEFCDWLDSRYRNFYPRFARGGSGSFYADLSLGLRKHRSFETIFGYVQRFLADPMEDSTLRACAATVGQANTAGRINMALLELDQGIRYKRFRDGDAPDFDDKALKVSEEEHGFSLRLQTHDSLDAVVDTEHPNWIEGVHNFIHVMRRPVVCKGRVVHMGTEADVSINWAHESAVINNVDDVVRWAGNQGLL